MHDVQDWLTASEYAVEGMASAKDAGSWSGPDVSLRQQAAAAAKAALIMAEVWSLCPPACASACMARKANQYEPKD